MNNKELCYQVVNKLWSFGNVPEIVKNTIEPDPVKFMLIIVKAYDDSKSQPLPTHRKCPDCDDLKREAMKWYIKGFIDAETTEKQPVSIEQSFKDAETHFDLVWSSEEKLNLSRTCTTCDRVADKEEEFCWECREELEQLNKQS